MTRKHFRAIASALAECKPDVANITETSLSSLITWKQTCESMARVCRSFNCGFDYCRFLKACNYYAE